MPETLYRHYELIHFAVCIVLINVVKCLKCWNTSDTYDPLLDISVETKNCPTLSKALKKITKPDMLDGDNKYSCPK